MNEEKFWSVVEQAKIPAGEDYHEVPHFNKVSQTCGYLQPHEVKEFLQFYRTLRDENLNAELAKIVYVFYSGNFEVDTLKAFLTSIIFQGKDVFDFCLGTPEEFLLSLDNARFLFRPEIIFEELERSSADLGAVPDHEVMLNDISLLGANSADDISPDELKTAYPLLTAKFWVLEEQQ